LAALIYLTLTKWRFNAGALFVMINKSGLDAVPLTAHDRSEGFYDVRN
jgi:hypothetical protein